MTHGSKYPHNCVLISMRDICSTYQNMFLLTAAVCTMNARCPQPCFFSVWGSVIQCIWRLKLLYLTCQPLFMSPLFLEDNSLTPVNIWGWYSLRMIPEDNSLPPWYVIVDWRLSFRNMILGFIVVFSSKTFSE